MKRHIITLALAASCALLSAAPAWAVPNFTGSPLSGVVPLMVTFTPTGVTGTPDSITWNFGGGGYANGGGVKVHTYNTAGTYTVTMTTWYTATPDSSVTRVNYITAGSVWPVIGSTSANITQPQATAPVDSCGNLNWRSGLFKRRWYNYAGPNATNVPVLSFRIVNLSASPDTLIQFHAYSLNERTNAVSKIYLYRDAATVGLPDTAYYWDAGDALLQQLSVATAFQTNDSILFSGLSNVIAANDTAWYHLVVDMKTAQITGNATYNNSGVMVALRRDRMLIAQGVTRSYGPTIDLSPACTPTSPTNNAYSIIIDNQAPMCDSLGFTLADRFCPDACDGGNAVISLGDSMLIAMKITLTNVATDSTATGWPKIFINEFSAFSSAQSMFRDAVASAYDGSFSYVRAPGDYLNIPMAAVNHPMDIAPGFYYLVAETKDAAGNVGRCSTLVNYKIDTKKPAVTGTQTFTLYYDANGNGVANSGDTVRVYTDMRNEPFGEICDVTTTLYGWYTAPLTLTLIEFAGDNRFEIKHKVLDGILDCPPGSWQVSNWVHVRDDACNEDSALAVLNNGVNNVPQPTCLPPPAGMVAWWPLDETAGPTANDIAGATHNSGLWMNSPTPGPGKVSGALNFDGTKYVQVVDQSELNFGSGNMSVDAWVKVGSNQQAAYIVHKIDQAGATGYGFIVVKPGSTLYLAFDFGGATIYQTSSVPVVLGQWYHVAVTLDRTAVPPALKFYLDGAEVLNVPNPLAVSLTNTAGLSIGQPLELLHADFALDEIEIFNTALTAGQVYSIFAADTLGKCKPCYCPSLGDLVQNGVIDVNDVLKEIQIAFLNGADVKDPQCPRTRGDVNNDGVVDVNDVLYLIKTAFINGPNPIDPCL